MKFSALALAGLAALVSAEEKVKDIICETSEGSPMLHHINWLVDNTANAGEGAEACTSYNQGVGSTSPTYKQWSGDKGGAAFQMYKGSDKKGEGFRVSCLL